MLSVTSSTPLPINDTPTKKTAAALDSMSLQTPVKPVGKLDFTKEFDAFSTPKSEEVVLKVLKPNSFPRKYVGDVDLDEKDEPLLKESKKRFVLFPIQYKEVSTRRDALFLRRVWT